MTKEQKNILLGLILLIVAGVFIFFFYKKGTIGRGAEKDLNTAGIGAFSGGIGAGGLNSGVLGTGISPVPVSLTVPSVK